MPPNTGKQGQSALGATNPPGNYQVPAIVEGIPFEPTEDHRKLVMLGVAAGLSQEEIASQIGREGIDRGTLRYHFKRELEIGKAKYMVLTTGSMFGLANSPGTEHGARMSAGKFILARRMPHVWGSGVEGAPQQPPGPRLAPGAAVRTPPGEPRATIQFDIGAISLPIPMKPPKHSDLMARIIVQAPGLAALKNKSAEIKTFAISRLQTTDGSGKAPAAPTPPEPPPGAPPPPDDDPKMPPNTGKQGQDARDSGLPPPNFGLSVSYRGIPFEPTDEHRKIVMMGVAAGLSKAEIAKQIGPEGIAVSTLDPYFACN